MDHVVINPIDRLTSGQNTGGLQKRGQGSGGRPWKIAQEYRPLTLADHVVRATSFVQTIAERQRAAA